MTVDELEPLIVKWAQDRDIMKHSNPTAQLLKAVSEMGELADAETKNENAGRMDAVGDIVVCLINYAHMRGFSVRQALESAYDEIKDRKGYMVPGGTFVKEEE